MDRALQWTTSTLAYCTVLAVEGWSAWTVLGFNQGVDMDDHFVQTVMINPVFSLVAIAVALVGAAFLCAMAFPIAYWVHGWFAPDEADQAKRLVGALLPLAFVGWLLFHAIEKVT